jgi:hypothetical protein
MTVSVFVRFDCEIRLTGDDVPHEDPDTGTSHALVAQAVQNAIGHTGATVVDVVEYEYDS